jgi:hypothetical protein
MGLRLAPRPGMAFFRPDDCPPPPPFRSGLPALLLHEACEAVGGVSRLAEVLRVAPEQLTRWLQDETPPPEEICRACADIILLQ